MDPISLQVYIGGMSARGGNGSEMLLGILDPVSGVLLVDTAKSHPAGSPEVRAPGYAMASNNPATDDRDALFSDADLRQAVDDFFAISGRGLLVLEGGAERFDPLMKIEPDGIDERGRKYRFAPDISDGQIAVVAICWLARMQSLISSGQEHFDDMIDEGIVSVGLPGYRPGATVGPNGLTIGPDGWPV